MVYFPQLLRLPVPEEPGLPTLLEQEQQWIGPGGLGAGPDSAINRLWVPQPRYVAPSLAHILLSGKGEIE